MAIVPHKRCTRCGVEKPLSDYGKKTRTPDGLQYQCKACIAVYSAHTAAQARERANAWRQQNPERAAANDKAKTARYKAREIIDIPATQLCGQCQQVKPSTQFHRNSTKSKGVSSSCKDCAALYGAQYYDVNGELIRSRAKTYRVAYYRRNRELLRQKRARYRAAHPDRVRAMRRSWEQRNLDKRREMVLRRRARKYQNQVGNVDYKMIWERDQGICHICDNVVERANVHFDHVIPLVRGGAHSMENIKVSHALCNLRKGAR